MRIRLERPTRIPPERLFEWWTDFKDGAEDHAFLIKPGERAPGDAGRRVLSRSDTKVEIEDRGRFLGLPLRERYNVCLHPERNEVLLYGENNFSRFSASYRFEDGKAVLDATVAPRTLLVPLDRPMEPVVRRFLARDLEGHLGDAERDLATPP
ncbi:MAG TPA: hypothetical protein VI997_10935 [Candidatus Thermoplasmatota archaeon]|nr:hypothetical protein [Candidatus Thermoplasmatota archaeon]